MSDPDDGHTFHFTVQSRMSSKVVGDKHYQDFDWWGEPMHAEVRAWNLPDACHLAADVPLTEWFEQMIADSKARDTAPDIFDADGSRPLHDVIKIVPGLMSEERNHLSPFAFTVMLLAGIAAVLTVGALLFTGGLRNQQTPGPAIVKIVKQPCDIQLLQHNFAVLDKAYSLAVTGNRAAAFAEVGKHYEAMHTKECQ